ncbi:unnamed protein product [Cutaneotrichosporon oleaginosum]
MSSYLDSVDCQQYPDMFGLDLAPNNFLQVNSDSSGASSPDIASLLPARHRWDSPMPSAPIDIPHAHSHAHSHPHDSVSPIRAGAVSAPPWFGITGQGAYEMPSDTEWRDDHRHPFMSQTYAPPRHHPYLTEPRPEPPRKSGRLGVKRRQKYTRSRTGCLGCRARRIKCDEARPICRRCVVAKRESDCVFPDQGVKKPKGSDSECSSPEQRKPSPEIPGLVHRSSDESQPSSSSLSTHGGSEDVQLGIGFKPDFLGFDLMPEGMELGLGWSAPPFLPNNLETDLNNAPLSFLNSAAPVPHPHQMVGRESGEKSPSPATPMLTTPNYFLPYFPTAHEQNLILHYCAHAAALTIAIPLGPNPMLAVSLPLALASPRGTNAACDALRAALLGVGAAHQAFLQARGGHPSTATTGLAAALSLREEGKELVRAAVARGDNSDAALAAATSLATIDIFLGGSGWEENFAVAKSIVSARGGPSALLAGPTTALPDGSIVTPARLSLEILAIYDTFASLPCGTSPSLLSDEDDWWFSPSLDDADGYPSTPFGAASVETQFGVSRVAIHLFARTARLLARVTSPLSEPPTPFGPGESAIPGPSGGAGSRRGSLAGPPSRSGSIGSRLATDVFEALVGRRMDTAFKRGGIFAPDANPFGPATAAPASPLDDSLAEEAACFKLDLDGWIESLSTANTHERVHAGDRAYAFAMRVSRARRA